MVYSCTNFTATGHCGHRSCIRWAIAVKMNFCKVLRCAFENNVVSSENTRSAAADDGCRRTRISTRSPHALYCSIVWRGLHAAGYGQ